MGGILYLFLMDTAILYLLLMGNAGFVLMLVGSDLCGLRMVLFYYASSTY